MAHGFIKDARLLEEKVSDKDYLDIGGSVETLSEKLSSNEDNLMIGIIGAFGVGKSTLLAKTKEARTEKNEQWIHFDAWQFPERKELWDGLVLETARQLSKLETTKRRIDGKSGKDKKLAVDAAGSVVNLATTAFGLPALLQPLFGLVKNLEYFADVSPARRVFEIQQVFADLINSIDKDRVVFVLEDTDRSGEAGLFFVETFKQFISTIPLKKKVVVIVAIANDSYYKNLDAYLKCLDYVEFFNKKTDAKLEAFIDDVFESDTTLERDTLVDFVGYVFNKYPDMNMRKLKLIFRQTNLNYMELKRLGYEPNKLICIAVVTSKYVMAPDETNVTYFDKFLKTKVVYGGNEFNRMIVISDPQALSYTNVLITNQQGELQKGRDVRFVTRSVPSNTHQYPSTPYLTENFTAEGIKNEWVLPDFYFREL